MSHLEIQTATRRFYPLIRRMARHLAKSLPRHMDADDLAQAGTVGMLQALRGFDGTRGASLSCYLKKRIRGAMLDELRATDPLTRDQRQAARSLDRAAHALSGELGRAPEDHEVAARAGVDASSAARVRMLSIATTHPVAIDDVAERLAGDAATNDPSEQLDAKATRDLLDEAVHALPERERYVLEQHVLAERTFKDIGRELGVSEVRAWQLHSRAITRLRIACAA